MLRYLDVQGFNLVAHSLSFLRQLVRFGSVLAHFGSLLGHVLAHFRSLSLPIAPCLLSMFAHLTYLSQMTAFAYKPAHLYLTLVPEMFGGEGVRISTLRALHTRAAIAAGKHPSPHPRNPHLILTSSS